MIADPPVIIGFEEPGGRRFVLVDTRNYFRCSLAELGDSVGLGKLSMPLPDAPLSEWFRYCQRDVEIIERAMLDLMQWWKDEKLGMFRWTAPSLSMGAFRHRFMNHVIEFPQDETLRQLERDAYYGGQLECYRLGKIPGPVYQLDVNSLYPAVMHDSNFPVRLECLELRDQWEAVPLPFEPERSIAEVWLYSPDATYPVRTTEGTYYANGEGWTTLAGPELAFAHQCGHICAYRAWAQYHVGKLFTAFVRYFWQLKLEYGKSGDGTRYEFVKLILNSLYGKFGQYGSQWKLNPNQMPFEQFGAFKQWCPFTQRNTEHLAIGNAVMDYTDKHEIAKSWPAIPAFVTSGARQCLRGLRDVAGTENVFYVNTDSLLTNQAGYDRLESQGFLAADELGALRVVATGDDAEIGAANYYRIGSKRVTGGVKASAIRLSDDTYQMDEFGGILDVIRSQHIDAVQVRRATRKMRKDAHNRRVLPMGKTAAYQFEDLGRGALVEPG